MSESNPYVEARREWNDRFLELVRERRLGQMVAGAELLLLLPRGRLRLAEPSTQDHPVRRRGGLPRRLGQVRENVYDSDTGEHLLIPQGTRLVGLYDHRIVYGQERVLITWKRLILPDGSSLSLKDGMPGTDALGAAGFHDEVNNHYLRIFGNALLLSVISAGVQLRQVPDFGRDFRGPSAGNLLGAAVGQQLGSTAAEFIRRGMTVAPTLEIRPGYPFNVMVTQDVIFPGPYKEASHE